MTQRGNLEALSGDPAWLPLRLEPASRRLRFIRVERPLQAQVTFLDTEYLAPLGLAEQAALIDELEPFLPPDGPAPHFIFHSAFAASTLLARALDIPGTSLGLKEPQVLNDVADAVRGRGTDPSMLGTIVRLLARPYGPGETTVIKPSNVANMLASGLLGVDAKSNALFLYAPLPRFLRSLAEKGLFGRRWARRLYVLLQSDTRLNLGVSDADAFELTDLQVAALGWLMHHAQAAALIAQHPRRVRTLDSETFLSRRSDTLTALAQFFHLAISEEHALEIAAGEAFTTHSKEIGRPFDPEQPLQAKAVVPILDEEINMVAKWAEAVARQAGVPMQFPTDTTLLR